MILSALLSVLFDQSRLKYGRLHSWNRSKKKRAKVQLLKWINVSYSEIKSFFFSYYLSTSFDCDYVVFLLHYVASGKLVVMMLLLVVFENWTNHIFPLWLLTAFSCLSCSTVSIHLSQMASLIILLSLSLIVASTGDLNMFLFQFL